MGRTDRDPHRVYYNGVRKLARSRLWQFRLAEGESEVLDRFRRSRRLTDTEVLRLAVRELLADAGLKVPGAPHPLPPRLAANLRRLADETTVGTASRSFFLKELNRGYTNEQAGRRKRRLDLCTLEGYLSEVSPECLRMNRDRIHAELCRGVCRISRMTEALDSAELDERLADAATPSGGERAAASAPPT